MEEVITYTVEVVGEMEWTFTDHREAFDLMYELHHENGYDTSRLRLVWSDTTTETLDDRD